jgi:hypothetical protein
VTPLPTAPPLALTTEFSEDRAKQAQWRAFVRRARLGFEDEKLGEVITLLRDFLLPPAAAAARGQAFRTSWPAGGPWQAPGRRRSSSGPSSAQRLDSEAIRPPLAPAGRALTVVVGPSDHEGRA